MKYQLITLSALAALGSGEALASAPSGRDASSQVVTAVTRDGQVVVVDANNKLEISHLLRDAKVVRTNVSDSGWTGVRSPN